MAGMVSDEASRLFSLLRLRKIQRMAQHTLDEIANRFPAHLIDDVNARGLPPDRTLSVESIQKDSAKPLKSCQPVKNRFSAEQKSIQESMRVSVIGIMKTS